MRAERPKYFCDFESAHLPDITWNELIAQHKVFAPWVIRQVLQEAKEFLMTEEGPHLDRRKRLSSEWLDPWIDKILPRQTVRGNKIVSSNKIMPIKEIRRYLIESDNYPNSGVLNVAGAEGHQGHLFAARYMADKGFFPIWIFEQNNYFDNKKREAPFLPLELRLSMWACYFKQGIMTVAPYRKEGVSFQDHYQEVFNLTGARYSLATIKDPNLGQKTSRGDYHPDLIIPYIDTARTTDRVRRLFPRVRV